MDAHRLLTAARECYAAQDYANALSMAQQALVLPAVAIEARALAVNAALQLGEYDVAIVGLEFLLARFPDHTQFRRLLAMTHNNRGSRRFGSGDHAGAGMDYRAALTLDPDHALAMFNSARLGLATGNAQSACANLQRLLQLTPDDLSARVLKAEAELAAGDERAARASLDALVDVPLSVEQRSRLAQLAADLGQAAHALALLSGEPDTTAQISLGIHVGDALVHGNDLPAATSAFRSAARAAEHGARSPGWRAVLAETLALPPVYDSAEELSNWRRRFAAGLDRLVQEATPNALRGLEPKLEQLVWSNFFLAYQGGDDRDLQSRYGDLLDRAVQIFVPQFCVAPSGHRRPGPARVGFLSSSFRECTAGAYFSSWVGALTEAGLETQVFQLGPRFDAWTERIGASASSLHKLSSPLFDVAQTIKGADLDLLIYPELGMDARLLPLAALRLARKQALAWGHPVTSGLPSMDVYFSCAEMEPPDAAGFYRERLRTLPGLGTRYVRPPPVVPRNRAELGLPERACLVLVAQAPFKIHPDNDALLAALALGSADVVLVLFAGETRGMTAALRLRLSAALRRAGADPHRQLLILPLTSRARFLEIIHACDLMFDTLHWSGGNTSLDALHVGLPIVTHRGRYMRGRQTSAMLERLQLGNCVAASPAALQQLALDCIGDQARREAMRASIFESAGALFEDASALAALVQEVETLIGN